jgi:hypothetical protein
MVGLLGAEGQVWCSVVEDIVVTGGKVEWGLEG